jgi:hypothetical protein
MIWEKVGSVPGVETPFTPDEPGAGQPDVLDANVVAVSILAIPVCVSQSKSAVSTL